MTRKRYCNIKATSLEEVLATCDRHIRNITLTELDLLENEDGTETDWFYINMFRDTWFDLRDDVEALLKEQRSARWDTERSGSFQLLLQAFRSGQVTAAQFQQHLQDPLFAAWYEKHK